MADAIVDFLQKKVTDALQGPVKDAVIKEGLFLYNVTDNAEEVQRELGRIRSFLIDADSKKFDQELIRNWVKEVRDVAYRIEDAVDTFQAELAWINYKEPGFVNAMKRFFRKSKYPLALYAFGSDLDGIKASIVETSKAKDAFGVTGLQGVSSGKAKPIGRLILPDIEVEEMNIVGFESDKEKIIGRLLDENNLRRSYVSIVGPGGIGKSTLAKTVYNEVKAGFEIRIWLSVSQEPHLIDLLKKMFTKIQSEKQRDYHVPPEDNLMTEIHASLKEQKYLVVLDDIWAEEVWNQLQPVFPDDKNGSRVLITSRFVNVAKTADPRPHELQFLNEEQGLELLLKKAFPNEQCQGDLLDLAKVSARKCGGLPLQLVALGSLLSRDPNYLSWKRALQNLDWSTDGKTCFETVAASYENLPLHLKSLFMSFSVFPEDYEINAQSLISYWCTEGFIHHDGRGTMYDKAEKYLQELVDRCMVQVTERNTSTGFIERCRVHTLLRIKAVQEAKEKDFITIFSGQDDSQVNARHASFHFPTPEVQSNSTENKDVPEVQSNTTENKDVTEYTGPKVRTLMFFGKMLPIHSKMKLLKVLIVYRANVTFDNGRHTWLENLIGLRHLEFRQCKLKDNKLPERIGCLHLLEYLDLTDTTIDGLPESIKCNKTLKLVPSTLKATPN